MMPWDEFETWFTNDVLPRYMNKPRRQRRARSTSIEPVESVVISTIKHMLWLINVRPQARSELLESSGYTEVNSHRRQVDITSQKYWIGLPPVAYITERRRNMRNRLEHVMVIRDQLEIRGLDEWVRKPPPREVIKQLKTKIAELEAKLVILEAQLAAKKQQA